MIKPLGTQILIEIKKEEKTKSGIVLATSERKNVGTVKEIGNEVKAVKKGQMIFFKGFTEDIDGLSLIEEKQALAILTD